MSARSDRTNEAQVEVAVGVGFEPTVGVNPQSLSRRSRYGRFGTPPRTLVTAEPAPRIWTDNYRCRRPLKRSVSRAAPSSSSTPDTTAS